MFFGFKPKSDIRFHIVSFLSPVYCDHFGEGIAGYVETEREQDSEEKDETEEKTV